MQINFNAKLIFTFFIYTFLSYYNKIKKVLIAISYCKYWTAIIINILTFMNNFQITFNMFDHIIWHMKYEINKLFNI